MVGPFMQGVLLMGVIYWYTKGMFNLINDYYRTEIHRKIIANKPLNESSDFIDVDQIVEQRLGQIKNQDGLSKSDKAEQQQQMKEIEKTFTTKMELKDPGAEMGPSSTVSEMDIFMRADVCMRQKRLEEFYKLVEQIINRICLVG